MVFVSVGWFFWPADREEAQGKPLLLLCQSLYHFEGRAGKRSTIGREQGFVLHEYRKQKLSNHGWKCTVLALHLIYFCRSKKHTLHAKTRIYC